MSNSWWVNWSILVLLIIELAIIFPIKWQRDCDLSKIPAPSNIHLEPIRLYTRPKASPLDSRLDFVWVSNDYVRLKRSTASVCHFFTSPTTFHIVAPAHFNSSEICPGTLPTHTQVQVWLESELVQQFVEDGHHSGTTRQMILKLAVAEKVEEDASWYVVMDSDVYARRVFSVEDLLVPSSLGGALRAKTDMDHIYHAQPVNWYLEAENLLQTDIVKNTNRYCSSKGSWGWGRHHYIINDLLPFSLLNGKAGVYGACHSGRASTTHVTPMILNVDLIKNVLIPRLQSIGEKNVPHLWYDAPLAYNEMRQSQCARGLKSPLTGRFYSWTEYSLYFVVGVASGALDQYHVFNAGNLLSFKHSVMDPLGYDLWMPEEVLSDDEDKAPLFLVHSWIPRNSDPILEKLFFKLKKSI